MCGVYPLLHNALSSVPTLLAPPPPAEVPAAAATEAERKQISKEDVRRLLDEEKFNNLTTKVVDLPYEQTFLRVETSLDVGLQEYLLGKMDRKNSRYIGIVMMEADTGRLLAMAGFDKSGNSNPCLLSQFPSASVFKIVTAASAVEHCGYTADTPMHFNGNKYTLYARQLKELTNRYTTTVSFRNNFV